MNTRAYYEKIASELTFPSKCLIDGELVSGSGEKFDVINPANGQKITEMNACTVEDVERAQKAARAAFEDGRWSGLDPEERKKILLRYADVIEAHADELAVMESLDSGKPIYDNVNGDLPETINTFRFHAEAIDKLQDDVMPSDPGHVAMAVREPLGVVGAIAPWNFPIQMAAWKIAPVLAAGNCLVIKPASDTPLTTLKLAELALEAGIPAGVMNVVIGSGSVIGNAIATHPDIDAISFTGSTEVGKNLLVLSGQTNAKRVFLEMGGKNPAIVMPDVKDLDHVAEEQVNAVFWNMGENCTSNAKLIVHRDIKDALMEKILEKTKALKVGNPLDPDARQGALINRGHMEKVLEYIEVTKKEGAQLLCGGEQLYAETGGNYVAPTIFDGLTPDMTIYQEEVFGPVLGVVDFETEEEAIALANDTIYGLQASLYTDDLSTAHRVSRALRAGTVSINCYAEGNICTPFGGFKQSGFISRDNSVYANRQYTEMKAIWIQL